MRCSNCTSYVPDGATHCLDCGKSVEPHTRCDKCGMKLVASARYCRFCGHDLSAVTVPVKDNLPDSSEGASKPDANCKMCGARLGGNDYCPQCGMNQKLLDEKPEKQKAEITGDTSTESQDWQTTEAENEKPCPRCGTVPRGTGRFCYVCGRMLRSDIEDVPCPSCGMKNILRYSRCQYCGSDLPPPGR